MTIPMKNILIKSNIFHVFNYEENLFRNEIVD